MQITVKSAKVLKRGENDYGSWTLVKVVTDKDVEYTTLAKEAEGISAGMVLNIDKLSIDEKDGKEKRSFKEFEIVSTSAAPAPPPNGKLDMSKDDWAEKDRVTRKSIEDQTRAKIIAELVTADKADEQLTGKLLDYLYQLGGTSKPAPQPTGQPTEGSKEQKPPVLSTEGKHFENVGQLFTAAKDVGVSRQEVLDIAEVKSSNNITDFAGVQKLRLSRTL